MTQVALSQKPQTSEFLTVMLDDQLFAIPVLNVQDVLGKQNITPVPLASPEILGTLNLRGRIITAINLRRHLGLPDYATDQQVMSVVVEDKNELFSLIFDKVGDVLSFDNTLYETNPPTLDPRWKDIADGIYRPENSLIIILNISKLITQIRPKEIV